MPQPFHLAIPVTNLHDAEAFTVSYSVVVKGEVIHSGLTGIFSVTNWLPIA